jgi:hypothetical protein
MTPVVTVCDKTPTAPYYYLDRGFKASLARLGVEPVILGFGEHWGGLVTKPKRLRHYLRHDCTDDVVIACDCWDLCFQSHPDEIVARWKELWPNREVVFNAERSLFPRGDLAEFFPETGTPWRYLNSGFMIGRRDDLLTMIESVDWDSILEDTQFKEPTEVTYAGVTRRYEVDSWFHPNDQSDYQEIWTKQPVPIKLDTRGQLCIALHGSEFTDFDLSGPKVRHKDPDATPGALHGNGGAKNELFPALLGHLGL